MRTILLAIACLAIASGPASAVEFFHADMQAVDGTGSAATGSASLIYNDVTNELSFDVTVEGLGSAEIGAHIHGADGSILFQLPAGPVKSGIWSGLGLGDTFQLRNGTLFILIHTEDNPGGEVRGDIVSGKVPVSGPSVGGLKARFSD